MSQKKYLLLNKDTPLLSFRVDEVIGTEVCKELERFQALPIWLSDINTWVSTRNYAKHKEHFKRWLKEWGIDTTEGFLEITHALGLNDTLWVKPADSELKWGDVSLYQNEFSDVAEKTAFETGLAGLYLTSTSPEMTAEGSFDKCWKREGESIFIYKKGSYGFANAGLEPFSEYYAAPFAKLICNSSVFYDLTRFKGSLCSKCELFTDENTGFIPFYKVYQDNNLTIPKALEFCKSLGFEDDFRRMIVLDSIIFNPDRHSGNFGFLIDNKSFKIKGFAPVFDHNYSLLARALTSDLCSENSFTEYISTQGHKLGGAYLDVGKAIITPKIRECIGNIKETEIGRHEMYNLSEERLISLNSIVANQIDRILDTQPVRKIFYMASTFGNSNNIDLAENFFEETDELEL